MKQYTVLLLRPDYIADNFGQDTFCAHVVAPTVYSAQRAAQREAIVTDSDSGNPHEEYVRQHMDDYAVLFVAEGHINDLKEE